MMDQARQFDGDIGILSRTSETRHRYQDIVASGKSLQAAQWQSITKGVALSSYRFCFGT